MFLFKIWFTVFAIGLIFYPISYKVFTKFHDRGWFFSKVLGICFSSWLMWILSYIKIESQPPYNSGMTLFICSRKV